MKAKEVGKVERHVRRDVALVGAGAIVGLGAGAMFMAEEITLVGMLTLLVGLSVLATAVWMKR